MRAGPGEIVDPHRDAPGFETSAKVVERGEIAGVDLQAAGGAPDGAQVAARLGTEPPEGRVQGLCLEPVVEQRDGARPRGHGVFP